MKPPLLALVLIQFTTFAATSLIKMEDVAVRKRGVREEEEDESPQPLPSPPRLFPRLPFLSSSLLVLLLLPPSSFPGQVVALPLAPHVVKVLEVLARRHRQRRRPRRGPLIVSGGQPPQKLVEPGLQGVEPEDLVDVVLGPSVRKGKREKKGLNVW